MAWSRKVAVEAKDFARVFPLPELCIALLYLLFGALWIVLSDRALDVLVPDRGDFYELQTFKGLNFVLTTAAIFYLVLRRVFNRTRRAEQEVRASEERFRLAGRATADAIWDWDLASGTVWWSDGFCRLFGYEKGDIPPSAPSGERLHPEDRGRVLATVREAIEGGREMWTSEYRFRRKDGTYAYVEDRGCIVRDSAGRALRVVGGLTDITRRKQAEERLERSRSQLRALSARLEFLREEERTRIAREIHDDLGQTLTALKMDLRWAERRLSREPSPTINLVVDKIVEAGELANATIASVQRIAAELRPSILEDLGLAAALKHEARKFQGRTGIPCRMDSPEPEPTLSREASSAVFRIFQEALTNVARHAEATEVRSDLREEGPRLVLTVADNGKGIRLSDLDDPKSLGLLGMRERAELLGGEVSIQGGSPRGTVVTVRIPLAASFSQSQPSVK